MLQQTFLPNLQMQTDDFKWGKVNPQFASSFQSPATTIVLPKQNVMLALDQEEEQNIVVGLHKHAFL